MSTAVNACPICGIAMYSFDRAMEMAIESGPGTAGEVLTMGHFQNLQWHLEHKAHAHLVKESRPGVYVANFSETP